jgi:RNase P subunit RPR2
MEKEWRCKDCNTLLGVERSPRIHLRYKQAQYIIDGTNYSVMAVCRKCSAVNEIQAGGKNTQSPSPR